jgi:plastocyanin
MFRLALLSSALAFSVACGSSYSSAPASPSPSPAVSPSPGGASASVTIPTGAESLGTRAFAPDEVSVAAGTTVTWTNTDTVAHTSTSDTTGWNSGTVAPGDRFTFTFNSPGRYSYHCTIHPGMVGAVVVQ